MLILMAIAESLNHFQRHMSGCSRDYLCLAGLQQAQNCCCCCLLRPLKEFRNAAEACFRT